MSTETKAPSRAPRKARRKSSETTPSYTEVLDASDEEMEASINAVAYRSEFRRLLDSIPLGKGKKIKGDLGRLRSAANAFQKNRDKRFVTVPSTEEGWVIVKRIEPKASIQATDSGTGEA